MTAFASKSHMAGFSFIEVLVSLLIISGGLLGLAGVQALAINNTVIARTRSIASQQASSIASAMSANRAFWAAGIASTVTCVNFVSNSVKINEYTAPQACPIAPTSGSGPLNSQTASCGATFCTPVQLAAADLRMWGSVLSASGLPDAQGSIACSTSAGIPVTCTVKISWSEKNVALNRPSGTETGPLGSGKYSTQTYSQIVEP